MPEVTRSTPPVRSIDLTGEICPLTFVKAKLALDEVPPGEVLEIVLQAGEQMQNVPKSIKEEGHQIEGVKQEGSRYQLLVRRRPSRP